MGDRCDNPLVQPRYCRERGLLFVEPYETTSKTFAKGRWFGRPLLDVLLDEYPSFEREYYVDAIRRGRILVDGKCATCEVRLKGGQQLSHLRTVQVTPTLHDIASILAPGCHMRCRQISLLHLLSLTVPSSFPSFVSCFVNDA
eukprot:GHVU01097001.1.p1 GENE.GHVU01097001.1~~GHVU01097001.1.p1  ORF type:complete len:143 (+),score=2.49 GHVU01097001.1:341-769(+)